MPLALLSAAATAALLLAERVLAEIQRGDRARLSAQFASNLLEMYGAVLNPFSTVIVQPSTEPTSDKLFDALALAIEKGNKKRSHEHFIIVLEYATLLSPQDRSITCFALFLIQF